MPSRISVELVANSSELQAAVDKAAASLKDLSGVVSRTSGESKKAGDSTIRSNELVARSYETVGKAARNGGITVVESVRTQMAAVRQQAAQAETAAAKQRAALGRTDAAAVESANLQQRSARETAAAQETAATRTVAASGRRAKAFGDEGATTTRWGKQITTGLLAVGAASLYMAAKYQSSTERLRTQAGATQHQVEQLRRGMVALAPTVGETPNKLTAGMYHVVSSMNAVLPATTRVKEELQILKVAAQGAQIGGSNLEETSYALASAMNTLHMRGKDARQTMAELNAIVGAGDMTMTDLLDSLKSGVLPAARTFGVSLKSVGAAMAVMGDMGIRGALAGTRLRMSLSLLGAPSTKAAKLLEAIGMSSHEAMARTQAMSQVLQDAGLRTTTLSADLRKPDGLQVALKDLNDHLRSSGLSAQASSALISHAFGGGRSGAAIMLMAQNTDRLGIKFRQIGQMSGQFGKDWTATTHTLTFELHQVEATLASTGIAIGTWLIPKVQAAIGGIRDMVHWLDQNRVAAAALGAVVVTVGGTLIAGYFTSKIRAASVAMREFAGTLGLARGGGMLGGGKGAAAAAAGGMGIGGVRSASVMPGSRMNPIAVVVEAGFGEKVGPGAGPLSSKASPAVAAEQQAAKGGLVATVGSGLKTVMAGLLRGGMVALIGTMASQTAGSLIGGKAGAKVSQIGGGAAIGAGIGSMIAPGIGTAVGGALGAAFALFINTHAESAGEQLGNKVADGMKKTAVGAIPGYTHAVQKAVDSANKNVPGPKVRKPGDILAGRVGGGSTLHAPKPDAAQLAAQQQAFYSGGQKAGAAWGAGMQGQAKHLNLGFLLQSATAALKPLNPAMQKGAAGAMEAFVRKMQEEGRLPAGSLKQFIANLNGEFPSLTHGFQNAAAASVHAFNVGLTFDQAQTTSQSFINQLKSDWQALPKSAQINSSNAAQVFKTNLDFLKTTAETSSGQTKTDALNNYRQLRDQAVTYFTDMRTKIAAQTSALSKQLGTNTAAGATAVQQGFTQMVNVIQQEMSAGVISTQKGMSLIDQAFNTQAKQFGSTKAQLVGVQGVGTGIGRGHAQARGGYAATGTGYVGRPGERGTDQVLALLGRGEFVLNATGQQMVRSGVTDLGTVAQEQAKRPHWAGYAKGGPVGNVGAMVAEANAITSHHYPYQWGGGHNAGFSGPYDCSGAVSAVLHAGGDLTAPMVAQQFMSYGLPGPGDVSIYASPGHVYMSIGGRYFGTSMSNPGGGADWFAGGPRPGFTVRHAPASGDGNLIPTPKVTGPDSALKTIAQGALNKADAAASKKLAAAMMASVGGGQTGGGDWGQFTGGAAAPVGRWDSLVRQVGLPTIFDWIIEAESSGNPLADNGTARGLTQINYRAHPDLAARFNLDDPLQNLEAAKILFQQSGLAPWAASRPAWGQHLTSGPSSSLGSRLPGHAFGGPTDPAAAAHFLRSPKTAKPPKAKGTKPGTHGHKPQTRELTPSAIQALTKAAKDVAALQTRAQDLTNSYSALQGRFQADEAQSQYLNADGSLNAAGIALHVADDRKLLDIDDKLEDIYGSELLKVVPALKGLLGNKAADTSKITRAKAKIKANKADIRNWRTEILDLQKPTRDATAAISGQLRTVTGQIGSTTSHYDKLKAGVAGNAKQKAAARAKLNAEEIAALAGLRGQKTSLNDAAAAERKRIKDHRFDINTKIHGLRLKINAATDNDATLSNTVTALQGALSGEDPNIQSLETVAQSLGQVLWDGSGQFVGVDSSQQGLAFTTRTDIESLHNDIAKTGQTATAAAGADNSQLIQLVQQQNLQLSEQLALTEAQTYALTSMLPQIPRYDKGGPVLDDGLIYAHKGEHVVPQGGTLVMGDSGRGGDTTVELHQHFHGSAGDLVRLMDQRIAHPDNVRVVSRQIGTRTSMLSGAPGGWR